MARSGARGDRRSSCGLWKRRSPYSICHAFGRLASRRARVRSRSQARCRVRRRTRASRRRRTDSPPVRSQPRPPRVYACARNRRYPPPRSTVSSLGPRLSCWQVRLSTPPTLHWSGRQVMPTDDFCDTCGLDLHPGWMTTGPAREWLEPVALDCPTSSTFTAETWDEEQPTLQCFGRRPITLEGILDYWCCRGITLGQTRPAWLASGLSSGPRLRVAAEEDPSWGPELHIAPQSGVTLPDRGTVVRIRGHFDDPAAETCRTTVTDDEWDRYPDLRWVTLPSLAVYGCRTKFVSPIPYRERRFRPAPNSSSPVTHVATGARHGQPTAPAAHHRRGRSRCHGAPAP